MDDQYLQKVLNGDAQSFSYFIKTYQNGAYAVAISIMKSEDKAKDVVQESFIQAYNSLSSFKKKSKFSTWLYRIVVNKSLRLLEKEKRYTLDEVSSVVSAQDRSNYNDAIIRLHQDELKQLIKSILTKMPPKEALMLQLFYLNELKVDEIVSILNFSKANVKILLHRARAHFYDIIRNEHHISSINDLL
ncbi:sigma-70 family RNA polymerase sigma factor [uncultured Kordia sp.]|uniref:RNA polymerase sigma factor n=1 Tax=uncultured Kordia sp. TaxID=507699 RepID=UPI00262C8C6D|nr:sigma-70 family RNA polymerase sigma factor [uncultured Kordia sp.]